MKKQTTISTLALGVMLTLLPTLSPVQVSAKVYKSASIGIDFGALLTGVYKQSDISGQAIGIGNEPQAMLPNTSLPGQREGETSPYFEKGILAIASTKNGKQFIYTNGQVSDALYKEIIPQKDGSFKVKEVSSKEWTHYPENHEEATADVDMLHEFKDTNHRYGFRNEQDEIIIPAQYREVYAPFSEGIAFVKTENRKKVAINEEGEILFEAPYDEVFAFQDGLAEYRRHVTKLGLSAVVGQFFGDYGRGSFNEWGAIGYDNVKRGYIDTEGHIIIDSKNDKVFPMTPYGALVENKGKLTVINREGMPVFEPGKYTAHGMNLSYGYIALKDKDSKLIGVKSLKTGATVLPFHYENIQFLTHNRAILSTAKGQEVISLEEPTTVIYRLSKDAKAYNYGDTGVMWVSNDTLLHTGEKTTLHTAGFAGFKIINLLGEVLYEDKDNHIQSVGLFRHGISPVRVNNKWGLMNEKGEWVIEPIYKNILVL